MNQFRGLIDLFKKFYKEENVIEDAQMKNHVYFKVGGPADILLIPETKEQVIKSIEVCRNNNIPFYVVGNGSNILVRDGGMRGVVIKLGEVKNISVDGDRVNAECGALLKDVSSAGLSNSLTGFEFACGIPGTVGGAVFMNAGAYHGEIADVIE